MTGGEQRLCCWSETLKSDLFPNSERLSAKALKSSSNTLQCGSCSCGAVSRSTETSKTFRNNTKKRLWLVQAVRKGMLCFRKVTGRLSIWQQRFMVLSYSKPYHLLWGILGLEMLLIFYDSLKIKSIFSKEYTQTCQSW